MLHYRIVLAMNSVLFKKMVTQCLKNTQQFLPLSHVHAVAILLCNSLCAVNSLRTETDRDGCCLFIQSGGKFQ